MLKCFFLFNFVFFCYDTSYKEVEKMKRYILPIVLFIFVYVFGAVMMHYYDQIYSLENNTIVY